MAVSGRVAQHPAQPTSLVANGNEHAPALPATPEVQERGARPHAPLLVAEHPRWPHQTSQPGVGLSELLLINGQLSPSACHRLRGRWLAISRGVTPATS
jgi:hypothetical protein